MGMVCSSKVSLLLFFVSIFYFLFFIPGTQPKDLSIDQINKIKIKTKRKERKKKRYFSPATE